MPRYLHHNEIDKVKWNRCIENSPGGLVYAMSWYLDTVSPQWDGLVLGDYEAVMPIPAKRKYLVKYLIQPVLCQQIGVTYANAAGIINIDAFIENIPVKFRYISLNLNKGNVSDKFSAQLIPRLNHELDLQFNYQQLLKNYARRTTRNIKSARDAGLQLTSAMSAADFTKFKAAHAQPALNQNFISVLEKLCNHTINNGFGKILASTNTDGDVNAAAFYFWFKNRIYFSVTVSNEAGKEASAMHLILDSIVKEHAGSDKILDFTGSSLKGVAYFNEGFGAVPNTYFSYVANNLPFILKRFKK